MTHTMIPASMARNKKNTQQNDITFYGHMLAASITKRLFFLLLPKSASLIYKTVRQFLLSQSLSPNLSYRSRKENTPKKVFKNVTTGWTYQSRRVCRISDSWAFWRWLSSGRERGARDRSERSAWFYDNSRLRGCNPASYIPQQPRRVRQKIGSAMATTFSRSLASSR